MLLRRMADRSALPIAVLVPILFILGWLIRGALPGEFLVLVLGVGVAFVLLLPLAVLLRLRLDVRTAKAFTWRDVALFGGTALLWALAALLPHPPALWVFALALVVTLVGLSLAFRWFRASFRGGATPAAGEQGNGAGPSGGPGASGKIIDVQPATPNEPSNADARPAVTPRMPGSTRTHYSTAEEGGESRIPGANFGDNAAPIADDWDPKRPIRTRGFAEQGSPVDGDANGTQERTGSHAASDHRGGRGLFRHFRD